MQVPAVMRNRKGREQGNKCGGEKGWFHRLSFSVVGVGMWAMRVAV